MTDYIRHNGKLVTTKSLKKKGFWSLEVGGRVYHPPEKTTKRRKK